MAAKALQTNRNIMETHLMFYIPAIVAVGATALTITRANAVHALLYLVVSLLAVANVFFLIGAPFVAALEVIIYAGAIMVLFVFVLMMLNVGPEAAREEKFLLRPRVWIGPSLLAAVLLAEMTYMIATGPAEMVAIQSVSPKAVGRSLFGPYLLGVELASFLLLAGLIGAWHLGRRTRIKPAGKGDA